MRPRLPSARRAANHLRAIPPLGPMCPRNRTTPKVLGAVLHRKFLLWGSFGRRRATWAAPFGRYRQMFQKRVKGAQNACPGLCGQSTDAWGAAPLPGFIKGGWAVSNTCCSVLQGGALRQARGEGRYKEGPDRPPPGRRALAPRRGSRPRAGRRGAEGAADEGGQSIAPQRAALCRRSAAWSKACADRGDPCRSSGSCRATRCRAVRQRCDVSASLARRAALQPGGQHLPVQSCGPRSRGPAGA
jgi:hypothetical protein